MEVLDFDEQIHIADTADGLATDLAMKTLGALVKLKNSTNEEKQKVSDGFKKKRKVLQHYINSAPGTKLKDKLTFMFGVGTTIF